MIFQKAMKDTLSTCNAFVLRAIKDKYQISSDKNEMTDTLAKLQELEGEINFTTIQEPEKNKALQLYLILLHECPILNAIYLDMYQLKPDLRDDLIRTAKYFGAGRAVLDGILEIDYKAEKQKLMMITNDALYKKTALEISQNLQAYHPAFQVPYHSSLKTEILNMH